MAKRTFESTCQGETLRGTPEQIVQKYEGRAYSAQRAGNIQKAEIMFQHAEHWKKVG